MCVSPGLKKPGDFTVSEGHGYPLVLITRHWNYCDTQWVPRLVPTGYPGIPPGIMVFYGVQWARY